MWIILSDFTAHVAHRLAKQIYIWMSQQLLSLYSRHKLLESKSLGSDLESKCVILGVTGY
jgi:hypothetical protein